MVPTRAAALACLALLASSAALAAPPPVRMEIVSTPAAGSEATAKKGQPVAATSAMEAVDAITTTIGYVAEGLVIPPGRLSMWRIDPRGRFYQAHGSLRMDTPQGQRLVVGGIFAPSNGAAPQLYWNDVTGPKFIEAPGVAYSETPYRRDTLSSAKSDLVYSGLQDGKPAFLYREFDGDLVRPARTEPAALAAPAPGELEVHGGGISVVSASDEEIRYRVMKPLDAPVFERPPPPEPPPEDEFDDDNENGRRPMTPPAPSVPKGDLIRYRTY